MKKSRTLPPLEERLADSLRRIRERTSLKPDVAVILGSGLGYFADSFKESVAIPTAEIPHYPRPTIEGHAGRLVFGSSGGRSILALQGRLHYYESGDWETVSYPIHIAARLGVRTLIVTNAAGGINPRFRPGDLMLITDQINLTFAAMPLVGPNPVVRPGSLYDPLLAGKVRKIARSLRIRIQEGTYCGLLGPSYETAAEIRWLKMTGADAVGMSTVNEVRLASSYGMRVAGMSCITNLSTGIAAGKLSHAEVTEVADKVRHKFSRLLSVILNQLPTAHD